MSLITNFIITLTSLLLCVYGIDPSIENSELEASEYLLQINAELNNHLNIETIAQWEYASNITDFNEKRKNEVSSKNANYAKEIAKEMLKYDWKNFQDTTLKREFKQLSNLGYSALSDKDHTEFTEILSKMESNYAKIKLCSYKDRSKCDLSLEPEIEAVFAKSEDPDELKYYWNEWYNNAGTPARDNFNKYVEFKTKAVKLNNFTNAAEAWLYEYEDDTFEQQLENIFDEVRPLYEQIHGYVRWRLRQKYGDNIVSEKGPIPMHLLGNMWGQSWGDIAHLVTPFPEKHLIDVTNEMIKQGYTPLKMFQMGDEFFQSLNMTKLPQTFWDKSIIEKPNDGRDLICHASAWDFYTTNDVRIKQCTQVTMDQLSVVHHELGHIQYFLQYQHLPHSFRDGANPGFHEAVGDVLSLSVSTPKHLQRIGLLHDYKPDEEARINQLFLIALQKIVFLPFAFTMDKYRWAIFRGELKSEEWNCGFWKLREQYSGIEPPVKRSEKDFDATAKYHISADVEYLRYLVSYIIQFQFYKAACLKAGQYEKGNPELPLDNCDFYGSFEAGNAFKAMLSMGASKPWPDAMEVFTGERTMSGKAIQEYFEPLRIWLEAENKLNKVHIGWDKSDKCD